MVGVKAVQKHNSEDEDLGNDWDAIDKDAY